MQRLVITIARSYGSGGRTLGKKLAAELGIHCYDRELIRMASDASGINEAMFGKVDENLKSLPIFSIAKKNHHGEVFPPDSDNFTSDENLFRYQAKVIRELADTESCIIIGRAADYVLKDREGVLRLFFYASKENCIRRLIAQEGISEAEAAEKIRKIDKYRANYYKYYTNREWFDAHNYDLCIDTAAMSYEKLISVVKNYIWNRFSGESKSQAQPAQEPVRPKTTQEPVKAKTLQEPITAKPAREPVRPQPAREPVQPQQRRESSIPEPVIPQPTVPHPMRENTQPKSGMAPVPSPPPAPVREDSEYREEIHVRMNMAKEDEAALLGVDVQTKFEAFLDAASTNEKYQILRAMRDDINDRLIDDMAASLDLVIEGTDTEDRYNKLKNAISMRSKYELERHRK